jgi:hypothetical protein
VFFASDKYPSGNNRHHIFMEFLRLGRRLTELKTYVGSLPLSDLPQVGNKQHQSSSIDQKQIQLMSCPKCQAMNARIIEALT